MSLKLCVSPHMISDVNGTGMARVWFPQVVKQAFLGSTKDGEIERSPDPVTMIDGNLNWKNNNRASVYIRIQLHRAPRSIVATNPVTVVIHDAYSWAVGDDAQADYPSVGNNAFGGKLQLDRASVSGDDLKYGRYFLDSDDSQSYITIGEVPPQQSFHFRYLAAVQTPGVWTTPTEGSPRYEAHAYWARLSAWGVPM